MSLYVCVHCTYYPVRNVIVYSQLVCGMQHIIIHSPNVLSSSPFKRVTVISLVVNLDSLDECHISHTVGSSFFGDITCYMNISGYVVVHVYPPELYQELASHKGLFNPPSQFSGLGYPCVL